MKYKKLLDKLQEAKYYTLPWNSRILIVRFKNIYFCIWPLGRITKELIHTPRILTPICFNQAKRTLNDGKRDDIILTQKYLETKQTKV